MALPACPNKRSRNFSANASPWIVCEDTCHVRRKSCLIFYGPGIARRVMAFPAHWHTLDNAALLVLSMRR
jgi:hypothetical protein